LRRRIVLALLAAGITALVCAAVLFLLPARRAEAPLAVWALRGDCDTAALGRLASAYSREAHAPVQLRVFDDEASLASAFEDGRPALLWCGHARAFGIAENGGLQRGELPVCAALPEDLAGRFLAVGARLPLLLRNTERLPEAPETMEALFAARAAADCWSDLLYEAALARGHEISGLRDRDRRDPVYAELYNLLAEAAYAGRIANAADPLAALREGSVDCAVLDSVRLAGLRDKNLALSPLPLPGKAVCRAEYCGLALVDAEGADFLRWLCEEGRAGEMALDSGLVPLLEVSEKKRGAIPAALCALAQEAELRPVPAVCAYRLNRAACEALLRESLDLLEQN